MSDDVLQLDDGTNGKAILKLLYHKLLYLFQRQELCNVRVFKLMLLTDMNHFKYQLLY